MAGDLPCFPLSSECHFKNRNHFNWDLVLCTFFSYGVGVVWSRLPLGSGPCLAGRKEVNAFLKLCIYVAQKIIFFLPPATSATSHASEWFILISDQWGKRVYKRRISWGSSWHQRSGQGGGISTQDKDFKRQCQVSFVWLREGPEKFEEDQNGTTFFSLSVYIWFSSGGQQFKRKRTMTRRKKEKVKKKQKKKKNVTGKSFLVLRRNTSLRKRLFWNPAWRWLLFFY